MPADQQDADVGPHVRVSTATLSLRYRRVNTVAPVSHPPITFVLGAICACPHALPCLQPVMIHPLVCVPCARPYTLNENAERQAYVCKVATSPSNSRTVRTFLDAPAISSSILPLALRKSNVAAIQSEACVACFGRLSSFRCSVGMKDDGNGCTVHEKKNTPYLIAAPVFLLQLSFAAR